MRGAQNASRRESKTTFKTAYVEVEMIWEGKLAADCPQNTPWNKQQKGYEENMELPYFKTT